MQPVTSLDTSVIQIGDWRVDPGLDEISRDDERIKLEPKLMQLLLHLARHAGQVVSVEQLLDEVWKDVVVTPDSVYHAVAALRRALRDDSKDPTYIANVMRRGYRLIAPVVPLRTAEAPALPAQSPQPASKNQAAIPTTDAPWTRSVRRFIGQPFGVAIVAVLAIGLTYVLADKLWSSKRFTMARSAATLPNSIAVLPFADMSEKHDQEYFADGMAEEILNLLAKVPGLRVIGRTSSFAFKGKQADLPSIARVLGVTYLVEGSVRRSSDRVRVTVQLVNSRDGSRAWSGAFDGNPTDILRLQDEIAVQVAHSLSVEVADQFSTRTAISSPEAYDYYLRGLRELDTDASDTHDWGREYFQKALTLDPKFTPAALGVAAADLSRCMEGIQPQVSCPRADASIDLALKLDPRSADAYAMRAYVLTVFNWDWAGATAAVTKAADLGGGPWTAFASARLASAIGDVGRARRLYQQIIASNPFEADAQVDMGLDVELRSGHPEQAEVYVRRGLQIDPRYSGGHYGLGLIQLLQGKLDAALSSMKDERIDQGRLLGLVLVYTAMSRTADSDATLATMLSNGVYPPSDFARAYAFRGDADRAISYLQKAYEAHDTNLWYIKGDPLLKSLERDPRYQAFLRKMNFPE